MLFRPETSVRLVDGEEERATTFAHAAVLAALPFVMNEILQQQVDRGLIAGVTALVEHFPYVRFLNEAEKHAVDVFDAVSRADNTMSNRRQRQHREQGRP